jgi:beta-barrel assembly-enhancing protease
MIGPTLLLLGAATTAFAIEPKVIRADYNIFNDQQAAALGRKYALAADRELPLVQNRSLVDYVQQILDRLGAQSQRPEQKYQARVVNSREINAFALPGGYIYVYRGLLDMAWNEGELAGMLAHEISHVVARHNLNRLSRHSLADALAKHARLQPLVSELSLDDLKAREGSFTLAEEVDADLLGFYTMLRAGWHPSCLITAFDGIAAFTGDPSLVAQLRATHPPAAERSRYLTKELSIADPPASLARDSRRFHAMKELIVQLPKPPGL